MAKRKRLNTGLVAFLTVMGMILTVSVVALLVRQGTQRDPKVLAENAERQLEKGDLAKAAEFYQRAYQATQETEPEYLIRAARCIFRLGFLNDWFRLLDQARTRAPNEPRWHEETLVGIWRVQELTGSRTAFASQQRERANDLLGTAGTVSDTAGAPAAADGGGLLDRLAAAGNLPAARQRYLQELRLLALASRARALTALAAESAAEAVQQAIDAAVALDKQMQGGSAEGPTDPRVVLTFLDAEARRTNEDLTRMQVAQRPRNELEERAAAFRTLRAQALARALDAHPDSAALVNAYVAAHSEAALTGESPAERDAVLAAVIERLRPTAAGLRERLKTLPEELGRLREARRRGGEGDAGETLDSRLRDVREGLDRVQENAPDVFFALARVLAFRADLRRAGGGTQAGELSQSERAEIEEWVTRALELEPALYEAYVLRANLKLVGTEAAATQPSLDRFRAALEQFETAARETANLPEINLRARLTDEQRVRLLLRGFRTALEAYRAFRREAAASEFLEKANYFRGLAEVKSPDSPYTLVMNGEYAIERGDLTNAILAYQRAAERFTDAAAWLRDPDVGRSTPREMLARLYFQQGQYGEALTQAEAALEQYRRVGQPATLPLLVSAAEALLRLDRAGAAQDLLKPYDGDWRGNRQYAELRARVLGALGRREEAAEWLRDVAAGAEGDAAVEQARAKAIQGDFAGAEQQLVGLLAQSDLNEAQQRRARDALLRVRLAGGQQAVAQGDAATAIARLTAVVTDAAAGDADVREAIQWLLQLGAAEQHEAAVRAALEPLVVNPPRPNLDRFIRGGLISITLKDKAEREKALLDLIAQNPDPDGRAREELSFYASQGRFEEALPRLTTLRQMRPDDLDLLEQEMRIRLQLGQVEEAARLIPPLERYNNNAGYDNAGGATYRGQVALARAQTASGGRAGVEAARPAAEAAIREYRTAIERLPRSSELMFRLGQAYILAGRPGEARDALEEARAINPRDIDVLVLLMKLYGSDNTAAGTAAWTECFEAAKKVDPNHPDVVASAAYAADNADPLGAVTRRSARWKTNPDDTENTERLARLFAVAVPAAREKGSAALQELRAAAEAFFGAALPAARPGTEAGGQMRLAEAAATFYAATDQREAGEALLRSALGGGDLETRVNLEVLVAWLAEQTGSLEAAETAYQAAQRLLNESGLDGARKRALEGQVGDRFIGLYQRQAARAGQEVRMADRQRWTGRVVEVCRWLLDRVGDDDQAARPVRQRLIEALLAHGEMVGQAEAEIADYLRRYGDKDTAILTARAQLNLTKGQRRAAEEDFETILQLDPDHWLARLSRGVMNLQRGRYDAARADLIRARDLARLPGQEERARRLLAETYERAKQFDQAETELRTLLASLERRKAGMNELEPVVSRLVRLLSLRARQASRARDLISEYMARYPSEPIWPLQMGAFLELQADQALPRNREAAAGDYRQAATYFERAQGLAGENRAAQEEAIVGRLRTLRKAERHRDLLSFYRTIGRPTPRMRLEAARAYAALNEANEARNERRQALMDAAEYHIRYAGEVMAAIKSTTSLAELQEIVRLAQESVPADSPVSLRLRIVLANYQALEVDPQAALTTIEAVLRDVPPGATAERVDALLVKAQALSRAKSDAAAQAEYREILKLAPDQLIALNNLAYALVESDKPQVEEARLYADRLYNLVQENPGAASMLDTIGWVYFKSGELERAAATLEQSLSLDDTAAGTYLHLGTVYRAARRLPEARAALTRGLELAREGRGPESAELVQQLERELNALQSP